MTWFLSPSFQYIEGKVPYNKGSFPFVSQIIMRAICTAKSFFHTVSLWKSAIRSQLPFKMSKWP